MVATITTSFSTWYYANIFLCYNFFTNVVHKTFTINLMVQVGYIIMVTDILTSETTAWDDTKHNWVEP
jgi:hypothetical protein